MRATVSWHQVGNLMFPCIFQERVQATNYEDLQLHSPFYSACQTVFYVFTFRYKEYTENSKSKIFVRVGLIITSINEVEREIMFGFDISLCY